CMSLKSQFTWDKSSRRKPNAINNPASWHEAAIPNAKVGSASLRLNESSFPNLASAVGTLRWLLQNVIRHARIVSGDTVEDVIERNLGTFRIAVLAGFNKPLSLTESCTIK